MSTIVASFVGLCLLLGVGHILRTRIRLLRILYLPSCVIGGLIGLVIIQTVNIPDKFIAGWSSLPSFLINIVFACLFLGVALPKFSMLCKRAGPQLAYGQVVAWGQYVVGVGLVLFVLGPVFGVGPMFGGIVPVGFEGGHGTAAGLKDTFIANGWEEGKDVAVTSATVGIISAILVGMVLVNWAARRGHLAGGKKPESVAGGLGAVVIPPDRRPSAGKLTVSADAIDSLTLHIVIVAAAVAIGALGKEGLWQIEQLVNSGLDKQAREATNLYIFVNAFPIFPLCMLGGLLIQIAEVRFDRHKLIDLGLMRRIQNTALDFLVVAAIATIKIEAVEALLKPFLIIVAAGIAWNVFCVTVLARRMLPDAWFERSIAEMGQSMGVTPTGLLLLRVVDPDYETPAADAFAAKQLLHEPFMGGGLWTSTAIPLLAIHGSLPVFLIATGAVGAWLIITFVARRIASKA